MRNITGHSVVWRDAVTYDFVDIRLKYKRLAEEYEGLNYDDDEPMGWTQLARDFIFDPKNNRAKRFVKEIIAYKV